MFIELDECEDSKDIHVISIIRDVKFICRNKIEQFNVNKVYKSSFKIKSMNEIRYFKQFYLFS